MHARPRWTHLRRPTLDQDLVHYRSARWAKTVTSALSSCGSCRLLVLQVLRDRHMGHSAPAPAATAAAKLSRSCSSWCYQCCRSTWLLQALSSGRRPGRTWKSWWRKEAYPAADLSMSRAISREEHQFPSQVSLLWLSPTPHACPDLC